MRRYQLAVVVVVVSCGCRAAPVSLGIMVIGDAIGDTDVENKEDRLRGRPVQVTDAYLAPRIETFVDINDPRREFILYPVKGDMRGSSRYVVEVEGGVVMTISKQKKNADGVEDALEGTTLKRDLMGKSPEECVAIGELGPPLVIVRSRDNGEMVGVFDVANMTNLRGARYCVLRFDFDLRCKEITLVGVVGSMVAKPIKG